MVQSRTLLTHSAGSLDNQVDLAIFKEINWFAPVQARVWANQKVQHSPGIPYWKSILHRPQTRHDGAIRGELHRWVGTPVTRTRHSQQAAFAYFSIDHLPRDAVHQDSDLIQVVGSPGFFQVILRNLQTFQKGF